MISAALVSDAGSCPNSPLIRIGPKTTATYPHAFRARNRIERVLAKLIQFRRIVTLYDKLKTTSLGFLNIVCGLI